jgi:DGQHR domain-containing protein
MTTIHLIEINQPIGTFYIGKLPAETVIKIAHVKKRKYDSDKSTTFGGVQRPESDSRINEIAKYCSDPDATFPTPIIISVDEKSTYTLNGSVLEFNDDEFYGEVIDGQHRIKGIKKSDYIDKFELPIIFMFNLIEEEKAYIFSTINSKQTRVPMSLIYDLFDVYETRSPMKVCHELARTFNSDETSPFYKRLKMLGAKQDELASLSQGSFVKYLIPLISKTPDQDAIDIKKSKPLNPDNSCSLRVYFEKGEDEIIYKILFNLFNSFKEVFYEEWTNPSEYILTKTLGYGAIVKAFPVMYEKGKEKKDLSSEHFIPETIKIKEHFKNLNIKLTSEVFPSNQQQLSRLSQLIIDALNK